MSIDTKEFKSESYRRVLGYLVGLYCTDQVGSLSKILEYVKFIMCCLCLYIVILNAVYVE